MEKQVSQFLWDAFYILHMVNNLCKHLAFNQYNNLFRKRLATLWSKRIVVVNAYCLKAWFECNSSHSSFSWLLLSLLLILLCFINSFFFCFANQIHRGKFQQILKLHVRNKFVSAIAKSNPSHTIVIWLTITPTARCGKLHSLLFLGKSLCLCLFCWVPTPACLAHPFA